VPEMEPLTRPSGVRSPACIGHMKASVKSY
jgi:hypothetical protein